MLQLDRALEFPSNGGADASYRDGLNLFLFFVYSFFLQKGELPVAAHSQQASTQAVPLQKGRDTAHGMDGIHVAGVADCWLDLQGLERICIGG